MWGIFGNSHDNQTLKCIFFGLIHLLSKSLKKTCLYEAKILSEMM